MTGTTPRSQCPSAEQLTAYIDGSLPANQRPHVTAHLAECPDCREVWYMGADEHVASTDATRSRRPLWSLAVAATLLVGLASLVWYSVARWTSPATPESLLAELVDASEGYRFTEGRLSVPFAWAAVPELTRSGDPASEAPLAVQSAAIRLRELGESSADATAQYGAGIALLALGRPDEAVPLLERAAAPESSPAGFRIDLGTALLESAKRNGDRELLVRALHELERGLALDPEALAGLFNQAKVLERLGLHAAALEVITEYLARDATSRWAEELRQLRDVLEKRIDGTVAALSRRREADMFLARWAAGSAEPSAAVPLLDDPRIRELLQAVRESATWPAPRVACLRESILSRAAWLKAYDEVDHGRAAEAARSERTARACAGLSVVDAEVRDVLAEFGLGRPESLRSSQHLVTQAEGSGHLASAAWLQMAIAVDIGRRGDFTGGLTAIQKARQLCRKAEDAGLCAMTEAMLAENYWALGDSSAAWSAMSDAAGAIDAIDGYRWSSAILAVMMGHAADEGYAGALPVLADELDRRASGWSSPTGRLLAAVKRSEGLAALPRPDGALREARRARAILDTLADPLRIAFAVEVDVVEGRSLPPAQAIAPLSRAIDFLTGIGNEARVASLLLDRGRAHAAQGDRVAAIADWERGVDIVRRQVVGDSTGLVRIKHTDRVWSVFEELMVIHTDDAHKSLHFAELGRSLALQSAGMEAPEPVVDHRWLDTRVAAVIYGVAHGSVLIWTVTGGDVDLRVVPLADEALSGLVATHLQELRSGRLPPESQLEALLPPIDSLQAEITHLVVVPDGPLFRLPFATLLTSGGQRLVERVSVTQFASLAQARQAHQRRRPLQIDHVLVAGYGGAVLDKGLPALRWAESEVADVVAVHAEAAETTSLTGERATSHDLLRLAPDADVIHIAAHAVSDHRRPLESAIFLAPGGTSHLTMATLSALDLRRTPTVVLSACDTGSGPLFRGAGPASLVPAFLNSGAGGVIASLWPVPDSQTSDFMTSFHQHLRSRPAAVALQQAQITALRGGMSPTTWAAFVAAAPHN